MPIIMEEPSLNKQQQKILWRVLWPALRLLLTTKYGWLALLLAGGGWYAWEYQQRQHYSYGGLPQATEFSLNTMTRVFRNHGFMVGYSEWRENPLWVVYHLRPIDQKVHLKRPSRFQEDWRSLRRVSHDDYRRSGYDRGHMAPNYAIANLYGREGQLDTFVMTNITPQRPRLNQKLWQRLEDVEANYFARWFGDVWVFTGPVFDEHITTLKSGVEIPDAFYKIYVRPAKKAGEAPRTLAFLIPQNVRGNEPLDRFVTSIDAIEQKTGLDFLSELDDAIENRIEASRSAKGWRLSKVARLPSRY